MERLGAVHLLVMKTQTHPLSGLDPLLSIEDLAEYLGGTSHDHLRLAVSTARVRAASASGVM